MYPFQLAARDKTHGRMELKEAFAEDDANHHKKNTDDDNQSPSAVFSLLRAAPVLIDEVRTEVSSRPHDSRDRDQLSQTYELFKVIVPKGFMDNLASDPTMVYDPASVAAQHAYYQQVQGHQEAKKRKP
jgi:hypothetical protein